MDPVRGWAVAAVLAAAVFVLLPDGWSWPARGLAAWCGALLALLGLPWRMILCSDAKRTRRLAADEDPGAAAVLLLSLLASAAGLAATVVLLREPARYVPAGHVWSIDLVGIAGGWALVHTAFALHYARAYYAPDGSPGGLRFEGGEPDDLDFAYFAFTIGMSFAASDVTVTDRGIRRLVLGHALIAFAYNTTILALAISLLFGKLG
ncbi:MAG: DUF1345 domain-containing protein [Chloroflexota bacterium]|nr:DUF1345 domain-containing protein [Chloroflexota bacterium]